MRAIIVTALLFATPASAEDAPYAGLQDRAVSSFSEADIAAIETGAGWGLALPAELNGWPGPAHVLELAKQLGLDEAQRRKVDAIFEAMQVDAQDAGRRMIAAERALDNAFQGGDIDRDVLGVLLADAGAARTALREVHLAAHLETASLLTLHQRMTYAQARGYSDGAAHKGMGHTGHGGTH